MYPINRCNARTSITDTYAAWYDATVVVVLLRALAGRSITPLTAPDTIIIATPGSLSGKKNDSKYFHPLNVSRSGQITDHRS